MPRARDDTFSVFLPEVSAEATPPGARSRDRDASGSGTVLVVEDEDLVREFASRYLEVHGYRCLEARNGSEALDVVRQHGDEIGAIVTDVIMPVMGGRELKERVAELSPNIPVLFISAYTGDEVIRRGLMEVGAPSRSRLRLKHWQESFASSWLAPVIQESKDAPTY